MAIYEYLCTVCSTKENKEVLFNIIASEPPKEAVCPTCGSSKVMRSWNAPPVIFKAGGFYSSKSEESEPE